MHVDGTIAVRGTTSQTVLATATILDPTTGADLLTLPGVPVNADTGGLIDLGPSLANLGTVDRVAVRVTSSGGTGSIIGALTMDDTTDAVAYEMPLRDPGPLRNSTGSYPWRLDGDYQTKVSVTNVGTTPAFFTARLRHTGGDYILGARELAPGATAVFDLRALRDEQRPDQQGHVLPLTATSGQFYWSLRDGRPRAKFAGRSEIAARRDASSSYSCNLCCTDSVR